MLTICIFLFSSTVAVTPESSGCIRGDFTTVQTVQRGCDAMGHDPLTTCEMQRTGAMHFVVRIRRTEGT